MDAFRECEMQNKKTHKRVVATAECREGVYNRTTKPSVVFCERREATEETKPFCESKMVSREVSLEERSAELWTLFATAKSNKMVDRKHRVVV